MQLIKVERPGQGPLVEDVLSETAIRRGVAVQSALSLLGQYTDGETDIFDVIRLAQFIDQAKGVDG